MKLSDLPVWVKLLCDYCGSPFLRKRYIIAEAVKIGTKRMYCSHQCRSRGQSPLTESQVRAIRDCRIYDAQLTLSELARMFGVSVTTIWNIVHGHRWGDI